MDKKSLAVLIAVFSLVVVGCTQIPAEFREPAAQPAGTTGSLAVEDAQLLQLVAGLRVGMSRTFVDSSTGLTSTVKVGSEYFSANGRSCRRFSQHLSNAASPRNKLACESHDGWREIPVASIIE